MMPLMGAQESPTPSLRHRMCALVLFSREAGKR